MKMAGRGYSNQGSSIRPVPSGRYRMFFSVSSPEHMGRLDALLHATVQVVLAQFPTRRGRAAVLTQACEVERHLVLTLAWRGCEAVTLMAQTRAWLTIVIEWERASVGRCNLEASRDGWWASERHGPAPSTGRIMCTSESLPFALTLMADCPVSCGFPASYAYIGQTASSLRPTNITH
jgi:hypothetical protein